MCVCSALVCYSAQACVTDCVYCVRPLLRLLDYWISPDLCGLYSCMNFAWYLNYGYCLCLRYPVCTVLWPMPVSTSTSVKNKIPQMHPNPTLRLMKGFFPVRNYNGGKVDMECSTCHHLWWSTMLLKYYYYFYTFFLLLTLPTLMKYDSYWL